MPSGVTETNTSTIGFIEGPFLRRAPGDSGAPFEFQQPFLRRSRDLSANNRSPRVPREQSVLEGKSGYCNRALVDRGFREPEADAEGGSTCFSGLSAASRNQFGGNSSGRAFRHPGAFGSGAGAGVGAGRACCGAGGAVELPAPSGPSRELSGTWLMPGRRVKCGRPGSSGAALRLTTAGSEFPPGLCGVLLEA